MTMGKNCVRRPALPAAVLAALLLAGCTSGHVGEDWQCPLAAGGSCASVAAADPAVPKAGSVPAPASGQPLRLLPRERETERAGTPPVEAQSCTADCGFDPFAWLARLFGGGGDGYRPGARNAPPGAEDPVPGVATASGAVTEPIADRSDDGPAVLPAEPGRAEEDTGADDLRTGEVVARIWIAPFVDAEGIYREAAWVRVVLEPAGWRLP